MADPAAGTVEESMRITRSVFSNGLAAAGEAGAAASDADAASASAMPLPLVDMSAPILSVRLWCMTPREPLTFPLACLPR